MLMSDRFVDKTDGYHRLLNRAVGSDGVFTGEIIVFIFCRRFGKTTFLRFIEALLNPLPIFKTKRQAEIRKKISSYSKGLELLKLGVYPVVMLDFSTPPNVRTLVSSIRTSLIDAGLAEQEADQICAATGVSAQKILNNGCAALNTQFEKELGYSNRKAVLLIDEYDGAHRKDDLNCGTHQKNELKELREAVVDILALSKDPSSSVGLMVVAGLTRMVGSGLSRVNTLAYGDVSKYTDYHGVCGILQTELVKSAGKGIDVEKKCLARFGKGLDDVLTARSARWNGFRFGYVHLGIETANKPLDSLFSPLDMWALLVEINKGAVEPEHHEDTLLSLLRLPSEWTSSMSSEFEFTNIQNIYKTPEAIQPLAGALGGGWINSADLNTTLKREDYVTFSLGNRMRILYELGLLTVSLVEDQNVLLAPPNAEVMQRSLKILLGHFPVMILPDEHTVREVLINSARIEAIAMAAGVSVSSMFQNSLNIREYAYQDALFLALLQILPDLAGAPYAVKFERPPDKGARGRVDIVITHNSLGRVLIEIKLDKELAIFPDEQPAIKVRCFFLSFVRFQFLLCVCVRPYLTHLSHPTSLSLCCVFSLAVVPGVFCSHIFCTTHSLFSEKEAHRSTTGDGSAAARSESPSQPVRTASASSLDICDLGAESWSATFGSQDWRAGPRRVET